jgi:O-antigen ligase
VQTLEPGTVEKPRRPRRPPARAGLLVLAAVAVIPVSVLLVRSKWGVLIGLGLAAVAGLGMWVNKKGFEFTQLVAFLIHFDGIGFGPVRMGRIVAASAAVLLIYKLVVEKWRPPAIPPRSWIPVLMLTVWAFASGAWATDNFQFMYSEGLLALGFAYFVITAFLVDSHEKVETFWRAYWYGGMISAASGIFAIIVGIRGVGFTTDPNFFGVMIATMIPLTVYYRRRTTDPRMKNVYAFLLLFVFAGAAGAGSRSGVIGASLCVFGTLVTRPGLSGRGRAKMGLWAALLALVTFGVLFVANPFNTMRGFSDRGAGRLDFWNVTMDMIPERPLWGFGGGQLRAVLPTRLATTPGVEKPTDTRDEVSSHNTWLDVTGDYGVVGLTIFVSIYVVAIVNLARPRWKRYKQLSTTMLIMGLPVLSGSTLLPLLNNKVAWSIIGLSAALQVPSWGTRYAGYFDPRRLGEHRRARTQLPTSARDVSSGGTGTDVAHNGGGARRNAVARRANGNGSVEDSAEWVDTTLARWDLRISRRFRYYLLIGLVLGMVTFGAAGARVANNHRAEVDIVVPVLDGPANLPWIAVARSRMQVLHTLVMSDAYAAELKELSGLDLPLEVLRRRMYVERPGFGPLMKIYYNDTDKARAEQAGPHLLDALRSLIEKGRMANSEQLADELRPIYPGEQRFYEGDLFLVVSEQPTYSYQPAPVAWTAFIGGITGVLVAIGFQMLQQRKPRVNSDDDFPTAVGMPLLTHVGRVGWRYGATKQQYMHVAMNAFEAAGGDVIPRRIVIAGPQSDPANRGVAMGVAAALAATGEKVVLVDAQAERPWLSVRFGAWRRPGLADLTRGEVELSSTLRRTHRWFLPVSVRRTLGRSADNLRFVPAGRWRRNGELRIDPAALDQLDDRVVTVLLAPPLLGTVPAAPSLRWADVVLYCLVEGRTVTFKAEDAAIRVRTFATAPAGVVLSDV